MSRLVAEVEPPGVYGSTEVVFLFRDHGGGNREPVCWPDDWPLDITLDEMRAKHVRVVESKC